MSDDQLDSQVWQLLTIIVDCGKGSKVLKITRRAGMTGGTILLGKGTAGSRKSIWEDMIEIRKEIVFLIASQVAVQSAVASLTRLMHLARPHHGIAFTINVSDLQGSSVCCFNRDIIHKGSENTMYDAIFTVVDRGLAESVVEAAEAAGSRGATIINARGAGIHETSQLFMMDVEPEKEIVFFVVDRASSEAVKNAIRKAASLDEPGRGFLFALAVQDAYGLFDR